MLQLHFKGMHATNGLLMPGLHLAMQTFMLQGDATLIQIFFAYFAHRPSSSSAASTFLLEEGGNLLCKVVTNEYE